LNNILSKNINKTQKISLINKLKQAFTPRHLISKAASIVRGIIILGISYYILYPLLIKISLAFMDSQDMYDTSVMLIPKHFTLDNIKIVWKHMDYIKSFSMSMVMASAVTLFQLMSCTLVAYGFARFEFKGKKLLFGLVIFTLLVPPQTYIIPLFLQYRFFDVFGVISKIAGNRGLNLLDTFWPYFINAITCMGLKNGLYIYMLRQFFRNMPKELEEASLIDGAGVFKTFLFVMLPSSGPILLTVGLFSFVWQWNDYFYMSWFTPTMNSLSKALDMLVTNYTSYLLALNPLAELDPRYALLINAVGCLMVILPPVIIYAFLQKYFIQSVERSGIVG
jgi:multiple sugar transport system permease protein